jgi:glycosyltransferase involved in cell wall biosynthesis
MIPTANAGVNYYRLASFAWEMRKFRNTEVALFGFQWKMNDPHPWQRDIVENRNVRNEIEHLCKVADVVVWQPLFYRHTLDFFMEMRAKYEKPFLVETDDNYLDVPTWNEAFQSFSPMSSVRQMSVESLKLADGLIVSTPFLGNLYGQFNRNWKCIPNSIDFKTWGKLSIDRHRFIRIGWIGGRTHVKDLLMVAPAIKEVLNRHLKYYADHAKVPYVFEDVKDQVYYTDGSAPINLYPRFMAHFKFDIGIAPLEDCNFNRAKSNLRWLEYSALKIPTVASDVGHFSETLRPGVDGVLIPENNLNEWVRSLDALVTQEHARRYYGQNAFRRVKADFNLRKTAAMYLKHLKDTAGYGMGISDLGGIDEQDGTVHPDRGFDERSQSRPLHYIAN